MKLSLIFLSVLSVITFRACDALPSHDNVSLEVSPVYSGGTLSLTPYISYEGQEMTEFRYGSYIAWIEKIEKDDEILYEYDEENLNIQQSTVMEDGDEREGYRITLEEAEPGMYDVHMTAQFRTDAGSEMNQDEPEEWDEYRHTKIQTLEVQGGEG